MNSPGGTGGTGDAAGGGDAAEPARTVPEGAAAAPVKAPTKVERFAMRRLNAGERLEFAVEAVMSDHPLLSQMLYSLTMGGPKPRSEDRILQPNHGIAVVTDQRLFVIAYDRVVMDVPRSIVRVQAVGGSALIPWADVRWGRRVVRTAFHWGRSGRDRFVDLLGGVRSTRL